MAPGKNRQDLVARPWGWREPPLSVRASRSPTLKRLGLFREVALRALFSGSQARMPVAPSRLQAEKGCGCDTGILPVQVLGRGPRAAHHVPRAARLDRGGKRIEVCAGCDHPPQLESWGSVFARPGRALQSSVQVPHPLLGRPGGLKRSQGTPVWRTHESANPQTQSTIRDTSGGGLRY